MSYYLHMQKEYVVNMKRWQCIFKASAFSELVNKDVKYFKKSLQRINDFYSKVDIEQKPYWYLISRLYYDDLTRMDNERIMKGEWKDNEGRANKSDKKEKSIKEVIVSEKELRDRIDNWASDRFNSDTKINPTILRTIISMMDIWFSLDKTEKRLQEIKLSLCNKIKLYYTLWDGTLQLIKFEDEVWKRKEHWRNKPPSNYLNSLWNWLIPYEVRNPKK